MGSSSGRFLALLALSMGPGLVGLAQNIASQPGTVTRYPDLTLLSGPALLSPARGANVPPPMLRRSGTLVLSSDAPTQRAPSVPAAEAVPPSPDSLLFKATLEKSSALLPLQPPQTFRRDSPRRP